MPRSLRWIAAVTAGLVAQFAFSVAAGALAVTTEETGEAGETAVRLTPAFALLTLGATLVAMLVSLAVNDWLARRYPAPGRDGRATERATPDR